MAEEQQQANAAALTRLIAEGQLPAAAQVTAETLLRQLTQPVRVTLLGAPQSGKSTLANLLLASPVLPANLRLPTVQIVWGDRPACNCVLADGSSRRFDGFDAAAVAELAPALVTVELPLPALRKISVMELAAPTSASEMQRALSWAAGRTDIALWCTQRFSPAEQAIWSGTRDEMKDHALLVATKADQMAATGGVEAVLADIRGRADQFRHILAVATLQAIAARQADGSIDRDQLAQSGGRALISAVLREVDSGRQAASDRADVLLLQYPPAPQPVTLAAPMPVAPVAPAPAAAEPVAVAPVAVAPAVVASPVAPAPARVAVPLPFARPATTPPKARAPLNPATRRAYELAIARLAAHGRTCTAAVQQGGKPDLIRLAADTARTLHWLSEHLNDNGDPRDRHLTRMREAAFDAADLAQLMQMERNPATLTESLSLMLQLKRDMEACFDPAGLAADAEAALTA